MNNTEVKVTRVNTKLGQLRPIVLVNTICPMVSFRTIHEGKECNKHVLGVYTASNEYIEIELSKDLVNQMARR